jgi:methylated-DNA-[protein]-cysteine S-methyltransferase
MVMASGEGGDTGGMAFWTEVSGRLSGGEPLRLFLAERDGCLWRVMMDTPERPISQEGFLRTLGTRERFEPWPGSIGAGLLEAAAMQVEEYFSGRLLEFDLPMHFDGTDFQRTVWKQLQRIPYGETVSYGELAEAIGNPKAVRAVGAANGRNKLPVVVPCHRVIGSNGKLTGFGGGVDLKRSLIEHEAAILRKRQRTFG